MLTTDFCAWTLVRMAGSLIRVCLVILISDRHLLLLAAFNFHSHPPPPPEHIEGAEHIRPIPYVVVGDEAFPLQQHVMRPYPGKQCIIDESAYNYRHSRARRIVECAFGILATRWRVFYTRMAIYPENVTCVVQGAIILHNMLVLDLQDGRWMLKTS